MTRRRIIDPGTTWALSRRTIRRYFLLNPDQACELEQCCWYCLGLAAQRFGVLVHAGCLMSTHSREVERVKEREHRAWQESKRAGMAFVGARRVLRQADTKRARSYEAFGSLNPQFAAAGHQTAATEAVRRLRSFNAQYDKALAAWTTGRRTVRFPVGTWWMRVCHGARCGPAP